MSSLVRNRVQATLRIPTTHSRPIALYGTVLFALMLFAQLAGAQAAPPAGRGGATPPGEIRGRIVDSASQRAITGGSITVRRAGDTAFVGGALPRPDGSFRVDGLVPGRYLLRIRALGFGALAKNDIAITAEKPVVDLGTLGLGIVAAKLSGQDVVAERETQVLSPDRNVYSTKNMTAAAGGTAIDVLRNIPLVEVDGTNKVSLRGNANVVIQINGRSSPLKGDQLGAFLAQLPAAVLKDVEVATNPSAKDDPEGTAGIINIVLNQETEVGLSGGVNAGTGTTGQFSFGGNVGKQQGKFIGFVSGNLYTDRRVTGGSISRTNLVIPTPAFVETTLEGNDRPLSGGGTLRTEYRLNATDALSFDSYLFGGRFGGKSSSYYTNFDGSRNALGGFNQFNDRVSKNRSFSNAFAFRRQGPPTIAQLTAELEYASNSHMNSIDLTGLSTKIDGSSQSATIPEHDEAIGDFRYSNLKVDYTKPINANVKLETGYKGTWRNTGNDFTAAYQNAITSAFEINPARTSGFDYSEVINGGYALYSQRAGKVQLQGGLRLENATTRFVLPNSTQGFDKTYNSAYPSGILTYNFSQLRSARASFSRRVGRPDPHQLSPIEFKQDARNVFRGNPNLGAQYINSFEFGFQEARGWGSIQLSPYVRFTNSAVRHIQFVDTNGISVSTFANVARNTTVGSDLNINYRKGALQMFGGGSAFHFRTDASNLSGNFSANDVVWSLRSNATWRFSPMLDGQMFANYRAPFRTEGGSMLAMISMSGGLRYKAWGDQGNVSLRLQDPFKLQKFGYRTANGTVLEYSERYFGSRALYLTLTRNFGQALKLRPKADPEMPQAGPPSP